MTEPTGKEDLEKMTCVELKRMLKSMRLKCGGRKADLVQRVLDNQKKITKPASSKTNSPASSAASSSARVRRSIGKQVRDRFTLGRVLGSEGKDGLVLLAKDRETHVEYALKVFKPKKSVANIQKEAEMQKLCAARGVAPAIVSEWSISGANRCFAMEKLDRTLEQVIRSQKGALTKAQTQRLIHVFREISKAGVLHNDMNVGKNVMMDDATGLFYAIDFGFSKRMKKPNDYENLSLLAHVDNLLKRPVFEKVIKEAEKKNGVVIDVRAKVRQDIDDRKFQRLSKLVGAVRAAQMLGRKLEGARKRKSVSKDTSATASKQKSKRRMRRRSPQGNDAAAENNENDDEDMVRGSAFVVPSVSSSSVAISRAKPSKKKLVLRQIDSPGPSRFSLSPVPSSEEARHEKKKKKSTGSLFPSPRRFQAAALSAASVVGAVAFAAVCQYGANA